MRIVFIGSPEFAIPILTSLHNHFQVVGVITQPDRPAGRGRNEHPPAVKTFALHNDLALIQPRKIRNEYVHSQITLWNPDVVVLAAYGQIIPSSLLNIPPHGFVNVHASLLPRWRGASPVQAAILHGDTTTGITIMQMDPGMDTGPIISQSKLEIDEEETAGELLSRLSHLGAQSIVDTLPSYLSGDIKPASQNHQEATPAPLIKKEDGMFTPDQSAEYVARQVRAFEPWPGSYFHWGSKIVRVRKAHAIPSVEDSIGRIILVNDRPAICMRKGVLVLDELQVSGKKAMPGNVFLIGARDFIGSKLDFD